MTVAYDNHYQTQNLFGAPHPVLMNFFSKCAKKGKVLDLGCGQGRDSVPLARLGFDVTRIDNSKVGIEQMNRIAQTKNLKLKGVIADIFTFNKFASYDFVLLDSMFHFTKNSKKKETELIKSILSKISKGCLLIICIQDTGKKVEILNAILDSKNNLNDLKTSHLNTSLRTAKAVTNQRPTTKWS